MLLAGDGPDACELESLSHTVTVTSPVGVAFHCARRLRVFARDILRLGTAMIKLSSYMGLVLQASLDLPGAGNWSPG